MRIIITGIAAFAIWCVFSAWVYSDKLLPMMKAPEPVPEAPSKPTAAEQVAPALSATMPEKLSVYFEFDNSKFKSDPHLDSMIAKYRAWLDTYPGSVLNVSGYTDMVGTDEYNNKLGMKRAVAIADYIKQKGIAADKVIVESKGESEPVGDNISPEGRAKNRRTEVSIKTN